MNKKQNVLYPIFNFLRIIILPFLIYLIFFFIRIKGLQPQTESGMGELITATNFIFGGSIAYFMYTLMCLRIISMERTKNLVFWLLLSLILFFLAVDEVFMIHEQIGSMFHISDSYPLLLFGVFLVVILSLNVRNYSRISWMFLGGFLVLGAIAVISDKLWNEGVIDILGKEIDYEQLCESFGALFLSCSILTQSITAILGRNKP